MEWTECLDEDLKEFIIGWLRMYKEDNGNGEERSDKRSVSDVEGVALAVVMDLAIESWRNNKLEDINTYTRQVDRQLLAQEVEEALAVEQQNYIKLTSYMLLPKTFHFTEEFDRKYPDIVELYLDIVNETEEEKIRTKSLMFAEMMEKHEAGKDIQPYYNHEKVSWAELIGELKKGVNL